MEAIEEDGIIFRPAWQQNDPQIIADARRLWAAEGLPPSMTQEREKEICAVAYHDGEPIAVSTVNLYYDPTMRNNMFGYRCMTAAHFRQHNMAWRITAYSVKVLQEWCAQNPDQKALGLMIAVETDKYEKGLRRPARDGFGMTLHFIGYSQAGDQLRVVWFDDATLDDRAVKRGKGLPVG